MSENSEQIEAKLAAYIDGLLTGPDKAEVEKHLAENPSHLALISDLAWHRKLLQALPREKAPFDVTDKLQSQLEREALLGTGLGDDEADAAPLVIAGRINRWPQVLSLAAILLLTVGVAVVVYSVLPTKHPVARIDEATGGAVSGGAMPLPATRPEAVAGESRTRGGDATMFGAATAGGEDAAALSPSRPLPAVAPGGVDGGGGGGGRDVVSSPMPSPAPARGGMPRLGRGSAVGSVAGPAIRSASGSDVLSPEPGGAAGTSQAFLAGSPPSKAAQPAEVPSGTLVIAVRAEDLALAGEHVEDYLRSNQIAWSADRGGDAAGALERLAATDPQSALKAAADDVLNRAGGTLYERGARAERAAGAERAPSAAAGRSTTPAEGAAPSIADGSTPVAPSAQAGGAGALGAAGDAATENLSLTEQARRAAQEAGFAARLRGSARGQAPVDGAVDAVVDPGSTRVILARNMSARQVEALQRALLRATGEPAGDAQATVALYAKSDAMSLGLAKGAAPEQATVRAAPTTLPAGVAAAAAGAGVATPEVQQLDQSIAAVPAAEIARAEVEAILLAERIRQATSAATVSALITGGEARARTAPDPRHTDWQAMLGGRGVDAAVAAAPAAPVAPTTRPAESPESARTPAPADLATAWPQHLHLRAQDLPPREGIFHCVIVLQPARSATAVAPPAAPPATAPTTAPATAPSN